MDEFYNETAAPETEPEFEPVYNRHYITVDAQGRVTDGWSDGPHPGRDISGAICIDGEGGYQFRWAESARADGGAVLRGNDVLQGTPDVLVCDSLTGNVLVKMLSAFTTGGSFESAGYGYGPGIGPGYDKLVLIVSRASGAPLVANALQFAGELVKGKVFDVAAKEFAAAEKAGLSKILADRKAAAKGAAAADEDVKAPPAEPCTASIPGIEVMDLEDAAKALWKAGIYAETGMGCTGPLVMMSEANLAKSQEILKAAGYIG